MNIKSKLLISALLILVPEVIVLAQSKLVGDWEGLLNAGTRKIKLLFHIKQDYQNNKTLLDSPDQGVLNIPIAQTEILGDSIKLTDEKMRVKIHGFYNKEKDTVLANYFQGGENISIKFGRSTITGFTLNRPQTPKPPFPYVAEEVEFRNESANNIKLAGTLTIPNNVKNPCAAILISGSGAQNRNEKGFDHEPFLILSDYLSRNGIAVLRFDDRGTAQSEGDFSKATSYDFSTDVQAAYEYLLTRTDIDINKIGVIGHSEGGMIGPMLAARNKNIAFVVTLAGPAVGLDKLMLKQIEDLAEAEKLSAEQIKDRLTTNQEIFDAIKNNDDVAKLEKAAREILIKNNYANKDPKIIDGYVKRTISPWFRYFIRYNPQEALEKISCPFLAINGNLDKQVNAEMNLEAMRTGLTNGKNKDFTIEYLSGLNHAFQEAKTGNVSEYRMIEQTMSPIALDTIVKWIRKRF